MSSARGVTLLAYADRLGGNLLGLKRILDGPLRAFSDVHVLPFFVPFDGADAGFDPIDHATVDPRLSDWDDIRACRRAHDNGRPDRQSRLSRFIRRGPRPKTFSWKRTCCNAAPESFHHIQKEREPRYEACSYGAEPDRPLLSRGGQHRPITRYPDHLGMAAGGVVGRDGFPRR